ncbi:hypothetical protein PSUM_26310 [Pseudomonas umsongensis]|uniref:Methyl-accepting chemotaxis protein n=1 Tax=Pseudomonas umsongensis TaxID=198618 RepID=A0ABX4DPZ2_9PSED|nr:hypothetical protein PSUM_26310 [Pseudomonas umsongensis]
MSPWRNTTFCNAAFPCGSEPARESGGTVNIGMTDPPSSRAGSLPQRNCDQACKRIQTVTSAVAAINHATAATASDASRRMRSTST